MPAHGTGGEPKIGRAHPRDECAAARLRDMPGNVPPAGLEPEHAGLPGDAGDVLAPLGDGQADVAARPEIETAPRVHRQHEVTVHLAERHGCEIERLGVGREPVVRSAAR